MYTMHSCAHEDPNEEIYMIIAQMHVLDFYGQKIFHFSQHTIRPKTDSFNMQGVALKWFLWMESSNYLTTWLAFVKSILKKFNPTTCTTPGGKLSKFVSNINSCWFHGEIWRLLIKSNRNPWLAIIKMFLSCPKDDIQKDVVTQQNLKIYQRLWSRWLFILKNREQEALQPSNKEDTNPSMKGNIYYTKNNIKWVYNSNMASNTITNTPKTENLNPNFKSLTFAERKKKTSKGLCFNYDEKFSPRHKCRGKLFRFSDKNNTFWELADTDEGEEEAGIKILKIEEESEISLQALQGRIGIINIRLEGFIKSFKTDLSIKMEHTQEWW